MVGIAEERPWRSDDYPALVMVWAWIDVLFFFDHNPKCKFINAIVKPDTELDREPAINYKCIELPIQQQVEPDDAHQVHALGNRPSTGIVMEGKLVNVWHGKKEDFKLVPRIVSPSWLVTSWCHKPTKSSSLQPCSVPIHGPISRIAFSCIIPPILQKNHLPA